MSQEATQNTKFFSDKTRKFLKERGQEVPQQVLLDLFAHLQGFRDFHNLLQSNKHTETQINPSVKRICEEQTHHPFPIALESFRHMLNIDLRDNLDTISAYGGILRKNKVGTEDGFTRKNLEDDIDEACELLQSIKACLSYLEQNCRKIDEDKWDLTPRFAESFHGPTYGPKSVKFTPTPRLLDEVERHYNYVKDSLSEGICFHHMDIAPCTTWFKKSLQEVFAGNEKLPESRHAATSNITCKKRGFCVEYTANGQYYGYSELFNYSDFGITNS